MTTDNNKVVQQIECTSCPWDKFCVRPPAMRKEEVDKEIKGRMEEKGEKGLIGGMMATMIFGGKDKDCPACPVFSEELRKSPDLANAIKKLMQER